MPVPVVCPCGSHRVKLMWEYYGWGMWCLQCDRPLKPSDLPVPATLAERVQAWNRRCARLARHELAARLPRDPTRWAPLEEEGRQLRLALDRHVPTYLYRALRGAPDHARCPDCGRPLQVQGRRPGLAWGLCGECMLWVVCHDNGRAPRP